MWKKGILAGLSIILLGLTPCAGQPTFEYGAKGGVNFSTIETSTASSGRLSGFVGGGLLMADLNGTLALQTEILYSEKGNRDEVLGSNEISIVRLGYVEAPLLVKLQAPLLGNSEAGLYAGPAPALKLHEQLSGPGFEGVVEDITAKYDLGFTIGVEFGFGVGNGRFVVDARLTQGVSKIFADSNPDLNLDPDATNHSFTLMSGFIFPTP